MHAMALSPCRSVHFFPLRHAMYLCIHAFHQLNDWFNAADVASRLHFRAASFCMGDSTDFDAWDQGISFFLPNMTWLQPPGYVHQMVARSWQPNALNCSGAKPTAFSAQLSADTKALVLRYL